MFAWSYGRGRTSEGPGGTHRLAAVFEGQNPIAGAERVIEQSQWGNPDISSQIGQAKDFSQIKISHTPRERVFRNLPGAQIRISWARGKSIIPFH
jgi:hypothetical protein